jgi:hypothetical protein
VRPRRASLKYKPERGPTTSISCEIEAELLTPLEGVTSDADHDADVSSLPLERKLANVCLAANSCGVESATNIEKLLNSSAVLSYVRSLAKRF